MGNPCPHLYKCNDGYPNVLACWNSELVDHEMFLTSAPLNCPNRAAGAERVAGEEGEYDESCSHKADHGLRMPFALQNFQLSDVYITHDGFLFNATHQFVPGGCHQIGKGVGLCRVHFLGEGALQLVLGRATVHDVFGAWSWAYVVGGNFYHATRCVGSKGHPCMCSHVGRDGVGGRAGGILWRAYDRVGVPITGIPRVSMRALATFPREIYHFRRVHQPMYQQCGAPSRTLWHTIRSRHFLHPDGLPLFNPDWTYRDLPPLIDA
ncbi:unnamed protein product [Closterium sp. NIES-64]|nr:unnamed protein product [Closterium sp. NIES-64]